MKKRKATSGFQKRRTLRLAAGEDERLTRQAVAAGISVSEYMRRLFFGGRPIIARTDVQTIREPRRPGGPLKHPVADIRATGKPKRLEDNEQDASVNPAAGDIDIAAIRPALGKIQKLDREAEEIARGHREAPQHRSSVRFRQAGGPSFAGKSA